MRTINSNVKPSQLQLGDIVLVRQQKTYKLSIPYDLKPLVITDKKGTMITAENKDKTITRTVHFSNKWEIKTLTMKIINNQRRLMKTKLNNHDIR
jgi:hypothetical protein